VAVGGEVRVHENVSGDQGAPSVTTLTDGSFVISWTQEWGGAIHSRRFSPEAAMQSDGGNNELTGTRTHDALDGGAGNDTLVGLSGSDVLTGSTGADIFFGGAGDDRISADREIGFDGNVDVDQIYAGDGNDVIFAGYGDIVDGGAGFDVLNLSYVGASHGIIGDTKVLFAGQPLTPGGGTVRNIERFDAIALTNFNDVMVIGDQADPATAYGYGGDDHLIGQENRVVMHGGDGNDLLVGSTANDELYGDRGNDILIGGPGTDLLFGGDGNDRFLFNQIGATDTIGDFQTGIDKIDLTDIDANSSVVGNQSFTFIGSAAFTGNAGELRVYNAGSIGNVVAIDVNGDSTADLMINLGSGTAVMGDFLL
jgi:serralysin